MRPNGWGDEATPKVMADLRVILGGGLTFQDNFKCAFVTFDAKTATENKVVNPLSSKPIAFIPCNAMSITVVGGVSDGSQRELSTYPQLNTSRTDGYLGISVNFTSGTWGRVTGLLVGG
jgi:hypothetical protein